MLEVFGVDGEFDCVCGVGVIIIGDSMPDLFLKGKLKISLLVTIKLVLHDTIKSI